MDVEKEQDVIDDGCYFERCAGSYLLSGHSGIAPWNAMQVTDACYVRFLCPSLVRLIGPTWLIATLGLDVLRRSALGAQAAS